MSTQEKQSLHPENTVFTSPGRRPWWRCLWKTWLTWPQQVIPRSKWDDRKPRFFLCRSSTSKWLIKCMMPRLAAKRLAQIGWKKNRRKTCGWKCCSLFFCCKIHMFWMSFPAKINVLKGAKTASNGNGSRGNMFQTAARMPVEKQNWSCQLLYFVASWYYQCHVTATFQPW